MPLFLLIAGAAVVALLAVSGGHPLQWIENILNKPATASTLNPNDKVLVAIYSTAGTPVETIRQLLAAQFGYALEIIAPETKALSAGATVNGIDWKVTVPSNLGAIFGAAAPDGWYIPMMATAKTSVADMRTVNENALNPNVANILLGDVLTNYGATTS